MHTENRLELRQMILLCAKQNFFSLGSCLHSDAFALQLLDGRNAAAPLHCDNGKRIHIRTYPLIFFFASIHAEAAPKAVNFARFQQLISFPPVNKPETRTIAHALERLLCQTDIGPCRFSVCPDITKRRIIIAADYDLRQQLLLHLFLCRFFPTAAKNQKHHAQQHCDCNVLLISRLILFASVSSHFALSLLFPGMPHLCKSFFPLYTFHMEKSIPIWYNGSVP